MADLPVVVPADPIQTAQAVRWAAANPGPSYLRIPRTPVPEVTPPGSPFQLGRALRLTDGDDVTVIVTGTMVSRALQAAESLRSEGIGVRVLNIAFVEPLDTAAVLEAAAETNGIVVAEEATITGGLGAAVATLTAQERPVRLRLLGVPRSFAPTGSTAFLLELFGLTADHIAAAARDIMAHAEH